MRGEKRGKREEREDREEGRVRRVGGCHVST